MSDPTTIKEVVAELHLDDDQSGNYVAAGAASTVTQDQATAWHAAAERALARRARTGNAFTATDLRVDGLEEPANPAHWGSLFRRAQAEGLIVSVGVVNSRRSARHGSLMRVWVGAHGAGVAA